jgi:anti-sigma factor (TIGR02949 family)
MKSCRDIQPMLAAYVDGEASAHDCSEVHEHLEACPPCRDAAANERTAREVVSACRDRLRGAAPSGLRARCAASAGSHGTARWQPGWRTVVPLSLAASILLAVGGVFIYSAVNQVEALAAQLTADHAKCMRLGDPPASDHAVHEERWAQAHGWEVRAAASAPEHDLEFLTIRQCFITDGRTAHMMYKWRGEPLSVFVLPKGLDAINAEHVSARFGYDARMWSDRGRTYVVVGSHTTGDIEPVIRYVKARTR